MSSLRPMYSQLFVTPPYPNSSFKGQTVIVTGSNVGLGLEAARHVARLDASKVILAVRSAEKGEAAKASIESSTKCGSDVVEVWLLDLANYASVISFADRAATLPRLDAVIENAGIATETFRMEEDDEATITVNVVSTFLLAILLLPVLRTSAKKFGIVPRLSIVSSGVHAWTKLPEWKADNTFITLSDKKTAKMKRRYFDSKLLEVFVVRELAGQLPSSSVTINMLTPGLCHSELSRDNNTWGFRLLKFLLARSTEVGSRTLVHAAGAGPETHGKYLADSKLAEDVLSPFVRSEDGKKAQQKIWKELLEKLERIRPGITKMI